MRGRSRGGAEGADSPHSLVPVTPEALSDAVHAALELLQAVVPDHPAVIGLLARRGRDEVLGCNTGTAVRRCWAHSPVPTSPTPLPQHSWPQGSPSSQILRLAPEQPQPFSASFPQVYFPPRSLGTLRPPPSAWADESVIQDTLVNS